MGLLSDYFFGRDYNKSQQVPRVVVPNYSAEQMYYYAMDAYYVIPTDGNGDTPFLDNLLMASYQGSGPGSYHPRYAIAIKDIMSEQQGSFSNRVIFEVGYDNGIGWSRVNYSMKFCDECDAICKVKIINELVRLGSIGKVARAANHLQNQIIKTQKELEVSNKRACACRSI